MADRPISSFTTTAEIDLEISRLAEEIQEIELLHKNLQNVRKLLGSAISSAQSASQTPPVSPNNHTLNSTGTTESSSTSSRKTGTGSLSGLGVGSGSGGGSPVSNGGDMPRTICACSPDSFFRICVNPRVTQEMEQHFAAATCQQQQRLSPPPSAPPTARGSQDCSDNCNMGSPPSSSPPPPLAGNQSSSSSSGGTGSTLAEFHIRRYPGVGPTATGGGGSPGTPTSSTGSRSTVAEFRIRQNPTNQQQGQVAGGGPMTQGPLNGSPYSNYCNDNTNQNMSSFQTNPMGLNYFRQEYPHIAQYAPQQGQNNMTY